MLSWLPAAVTWAGMDLCLKTPELLKENILCPVFEFGLCYAGIL